MNINFRELIPLADKRAIGVFDSGLGGLTVVKELISIMPNEDIIYFGDTGRVPYGSRSREIINKYAREDEEFLLSKNVKMIIAACGTVSSVAADTAINLPVPFFEVVSHSARAAVKATKNNIIGVIGTSATINSGKHKEIINSLRAEAQVISVDCPLFVPLVESGWTDPCDTVVLETVKRYLKPIIDANADTLILGCTHYPILSEAISKVLGEGVTLINAGTSLSVAVNEYLIQNSLTNDAQSNGKIKLYVSDKPDSFLKTASSLLGKNIDNKMIEQVNLENL